VLGCERRPDSTAHVRLPDPRWHQRVQRGSANQDGDGDESFFDRTDTHPRVLVTLGPLVVVGVDGSDCSREALRFAVGEAQMRGARLRIVTAWSVPAMAYSGGFAANVDPDMFRKDMEAESVMAVAFARELGPTLEIEATTPNAQSAAALLAAAESADLLVVGSRGHGGFARLLLGSVSEQLAHHAECPLVIVRSPTLGLRDG
jgi:nucleotide-binding universal stress UspA family protein